MPINYNMENFISFANNLADESEKIIMNYFRKSMNTESKQDNSPNTVAESLASGVPIMPKTPHSS